MKVSKFIEWLKTQDQNADVKVLVNQRARAWEGDLQSYESFDVVEHAEYVDMRGNEFAEGTPFENIRTLFLGLDE